MLSPHEPSGLLAPELRDAAFGLVAAIDEPPIQYASKLSLEGFGQPYVSSGGSRYGTFLYGGTSFLFGDMLGGQKLGAALQLGTRREDFAAQIRYLNRQHRWSWGTTSSSTARSWPTRATRCCPSSTFRSASAARS